MDLVSIVVPVYNSHQYINECVDSILSQSYTEFELILVDDGSVDNSFTMCEQYALRDRRVRVIHQNNRGASAARNVGINAATGKYLCFVDSDDWIRSGYIADLVRDLSPNEGDGLVIHGLKEFNLKREMIRDVSFPERKLVGKDVALAFTEMEVYNSGYSASKLYSLRLINQYHIRFNEEIIHAEDMLFMLDYLKHANYVKFNSISNYIYELRHASLSSSNRPYWSEKKCYERMKKNRLELIQLFGLQEWELNKMEQVTSLFLSRALMALFRPPYALPYKERMQQLYALTDYDLTILKKYYYPWRIFDKIGKVLLINRFYWFYERIMSLFFFVRYHKLLAN